MGQARRTQPKSSSTGRFPEVQTMKLNTQTPVHRHGWKRAALEWACLGFMAIALVLAAGWVHTASEEADSFGFRNLASWGPHDVDLIVGRGQLAICHRFDDEGMGQALQVNPRTPGVPIRWNGRMEVPGLRIHCEQFAKAGAPLVWDLRISLLILAATAVLAAAICRRSLLLLRCKLNPPSHPAPPAPLRAV
ncbi:hypothetical protein TA3x_002432 [Tundrisphaera sp. TA3]|uniref:hypothetical protein n=1 Tax=Tundrisphaera sp. TA3 TaxID=3435775 RepID=UPI003EBA805A